MNRINEALEWCGKAITVIENDNTDDAYKLGYLEAVVIIVKSKLEHEINSQNLNKAE